MSDDTEERARWLALRRAGLGSSNFSILLGAFGAIGAAWDATPRSLAEADLDPQYIRAFEKARATFDAGREIELLERHEARALTWLDGDYPDMLRTIPQSPPVLFVRGAKGPQFDQALAVVGTRHVTAYGRQVCEEFCATVARAGVAIISGLARGVDTIAHRVALENGVPTVAVLAGGIEQVYPRENLGLANRIREQGCLVSEYPVGIPARPDYFPRRNRILSGLARATLVVEAGEGSGALHTANWAFEQQRDVFAIPGSVYSRQSAGTNQLIREHTARLVSSPEQLCEELNLVSATGQFPLPGQPVREPASPARSASPRPAAVAQPRPEVSEGEGRVLHWLAEGPLHVDEVCRASGLAVAEVSATLQILELKGLVRQDRPMVYAAL